LQQILQPAAILIVALVAPTSGIQIQHNGKMAEGEIRRGRECSTNAREVAPRSGTDFGGG
jgi:hypothetical protein